MNEKRPGEFAPEDPIDLLVQPVFTAQPTFSESFHTT